GPSHEVVVLRDRHGDAGNVRLLEGVLSEREGTHLAGDGHQRGAVHPGVGDRRDQVRRARTARRDADTDLSTGAGITLGGVPGSLLMAAEYVMELTLVIGERVVEGHDRPAGNAEDQVDALADECLADDLCTGTFFRHRIFLHASVWRL